MLLVLRLASTAASSRRACSLRGSTKLLSSATGTGRVTLLPATRSVMPVIFAVDRRGSRRKRNVAAGASACSRSKRSMPLIILR
jgi:hypothetical protein